MNLLAISIAPIFKEHVQGGSQKIFMDAMRVVSQKHNIRVYCTGRDDNCEPFKINAQFEVFPTLGFRQFFPFPYMTNPWKLGEIIRTISEETEWADAVYLHADGFYFKKFLTLRKQIPVISSLHDFVYPISISSAFLGDVDRVIVPSNYIKECFRHSVGRVYENFMDRIVVVNNGLDATMYHYDSVQSAAWRDKMETGKDDVVLLYPHRPEISKGINDALTLLRRLNGEGLEAKLWIPRHFDLKVNKELQRDEVIFRRRITKEGLRSYVKFFDWQTPQTMRYVYSTANITLNLGNFVESFGLVPLESLLCETPVLATKAGCLRHNLPDMTGVLKIDFGDTSAAYMACKQLLCGGRARQARSYVLNKYPHKKMTEQYLDIFENTDIAPPLRCRINFSEEKDAAYRIAPWCYIGLRGIYDDYKGEFVKVAPAVYKLLASKSQLTREDLAGQFDMLKKQGIIVRDHD